MGKGTVSLRIVFAAIVVLYLQGWPVLHAQRPPLTLEAALQAAGQNNRLLHAARLQINEVEGDLTGARLRFINNPELFSAIGPRRSGNPLGGRSTELLIGIEQRFETGGQRDYRIERALADIEAVTASALDVQRFVEFAVASTFYETLAADRRLGLLEQNELLASQLHDVAVRRLEAGEGTPLEVNTARIRLAEVERRALEARLGFEVSTVRLAELLDLPPETPLQLQGDLSGDEQAPEAARLIASALRTRPDLAAVGHEIDAAVASISLADADANPDIAVGVSYGREEGDDILVAGLSIPLPFFNRNQGERERARATRLRLKAEQNLARLAIESEVRQSLLAYEQTRRAVQLYDADVLRAQEESAGLLQSALEAGEVGIAEVIVVQRELLEGQEGYLDASLALALSRAGVLAATSQSQIGPLTGATP